MAVISTTKDWTGISGEFLGSCHKCNVIGLDCEWVTEKSCGSRQPVALLQLATAHDMCLLVRLNRIGKDIPNELKILLEDRRLALFLLPKRLTLATDLESLNFVGF